MKSFVMSIFLLTTAIGSVISIALSSVSVDPKLVWLYTGISAAAFVAGWVFWGLFRGYNQLEDKMDVMDSEDPQTTVSVQEVRLHRQNTIIGADEENPEMGM
jgi:proton-dependent oligopeptide transporter, POT family